MTRDDLLLAQGLGADWPAEVAVGEGMYPVRACDDGYEVLNGDGEVYQVGLDGGRSCTCPHYQYRGGPDDSDCKHLASLRAAHLLPAERPARRPWRRPAPPAPTGRMATRGQLQALAQLTARLGMSEQEVYYLVQQQYRVEVPQDLTEAQAAELSNDLLGRVGRGETV
jgi:hypothetical protein